MLPLSEHVVFVQLDKIICPRVSANSPMRNGIIPSQKIRETNCSVIVAVASGTKGSRRKSIMRTPSGGRRATKGTLPEDIEVRTASSSWSMICGSSMHSGHTEQAQH